MFIVNLYVILTAHTVGTNYDQACLIWAGIDKLSLCLGIFLASLWICLHEVYHPSSAAILIINFYFCYQCDTSPELH